MDIALVYMVAGISSRFGGRIKQFSEVGPNNETLIEYSMNQALPAGFTKIVLIVGNRTEHPFKEKFGNSYKEIPIQYTLQKFDEEKRDRPWGTVDALCTIKDAVKCPFVICNGDDIYGEESFQILIDQLKTKSTGATTGYKLGNVLPEKGGVNRAIFEVNSNDEIQSLKEEFDLTKENLDEKGLSENSLCSMNIFGLQPDTVRKLNGILEKFKEEHKGDRRIECLLPNELGNLIKENKLIINLYPTNGKWFGVTNPGDEIKIKESLKSS